jgi:hypothetical protein
VNPAHAPVMAALAGDDAEPLDGTSAPGIIGRLLKPARQPVANRFRSRTTQIGT